MSIYITKMNALTIVLVLVLVYTLYNYPEIIQSARGTAERYVYSPEMVEQSILEEDLVLTEDNTSTTKGENFMNSREGVGSWEPSTAEFENVDNQKLFQSYAEDLKANVDQAIVESHREYTADTDYLATTGASHQSDRDDFRPAVQFHGLPRKAHYSQIGAENSARTAQSETPEEVMNIKTHNSFGYTL